MKQYNISRVLCVALLATIIILNGCTTGAIGGEPPETATPLGCHKHHNRYYNPKTGQCEEMVDDHQRFVLNAYRRVHQVAQEIEGEVEYSIYPKKYLTIDEAEVLWSELREKGAKMIVMGGPFPDDRIYDPEEEWDLKWQQEHNNKPRIWGGPAGGSGCGWMQREDAPADTIRGMLIEGLNTQEKERPRPQLRRAILEDNDCRIGTIVVLFNTKKMLDWIDRHWDEIEGVQPKVDFIDKRMPGLGPLKPLKERE